MPYFVSGSFYEALQATANACNSVAKHEREAQMEAFQRVVTPMKSWVLEDYPRLMKVLLLRVIEIPYAANLANARRNGNSQGCTSKSFH